MLLCRALPAPRVSVLMSVYNDAPYVAQAIESILAQTFRELELVVVIDGSTDGSREIVVGYSDPRIRVLDLATNIGQTRALNRGLATIESEYIARLDADDLAFPPRIERQVAWMDAHPDVAALGVQARRIDHAGRRLHRFDWRFRMWPRPRGGTAMEWYRMFDTPLVHSGAMFRRSMVCEVLGGYDERYPLEQDSDLWVRTARRYPLANLEERLVAYRSHALSMTRDRARHEWNGHRERKAAIIHAAMRDVLRWDDVPLRWAQLWNSVNNSSCSPADIPELLEVLDHCATRFFEIHPEARHDPFIARHRVSLLGRAADRVRTSDRRLALSIVPHMFACHAGTALLLFARLAVLAVFGDRASKLWRLVAGRR